jgi:nitric oxide reductase subunit B
MLLLGMNIGLMATCVLSLLSVGLLQTPASVNEGCWFARNSEQTRCQC